jgi:hypothetical protein
MSFAPLFYDSVVRLKWRLSGYGCVACSGHSRPAFNYSGGEKSLCNLISCAGVW